MMKFVLILCCAMLLSSRAIFAQEIKKDTLIDEQQQEMLTMILFNLVCGDRNTQDGEKEKQRQDSVRKAVETKYKPGTLSADFKFKDVNGKVFSLKDLRGNYVYIDVWATWCGPCCKEIPSLQKLEEKMHGKKITFVSISWDREQNDWMKMLEEKKLGGLQLHFGGDEAFFKEYGIEFIPRFILLDKKGRVVNAYMTRPSDPKTEEIFNTLKGI